KADLFRALASRQHPDPVIGANRRANVSRAVISETVNGVRVTVGLDSGLWVVGETILPVGEAVIGPKSIRRGRYRDAGHPHVEGALACHPAVSELVELDDGVTRIASLADVAKTLPEVVPVEWTSEDRACPLVEHRVLEVDPLHHLRIADGQVGVTRRAENLVAAENVSELANINLLWHGEQWWKSRAQMSDTRILSL